MDSAEALERFRTSDSTRESTAHVARVAHAGLEPATPRRILASVATAPVAGRISTTIAQILLIGVRGRWDGYCRTSTQLRSSRARTI